MKDVVIGCITNYTFENIKLFVNSIDRSGFTGHKVMIVYNVPFSTVNELKKRGWIVVVFNEDVENQRYTYRDNFIVTVDRHLHYYLTLKQLAEQSPEGLRYVLALDPKDVIFQYNPSEWLEKNLGDYKINAGRESVKYEHEVWGRSNMIESFGEVVYERCKENITVNAGTIAGEWKTMSELFLNVYLMCQGSPSATPDQAAVNVALSFSPYKELTRFTNSEEGWAAQCGTTVDQRMVRQYGENLLEPAPIMDGDIVKTSTGIPFAMVHQYDRIPEWNQIITKKYEMENTIGVHYQCWKNKPNVIIALESFRKYYPNAPVRMVSDAGDDFSDLAEKYNCIFDYEDININPRGILIGHPIWKKGATYEGVKLWLKRVYDTCKKLNTDWIVFLEDDVETNNIIKNFPNVNGAGAPHTSPFTNDLTNYLKQRNSINTLWSYNMCGGAILDRKFFIEAYEKYINEFDVILIAGMDNRVGGWGDILLNVFIIFCGGTTGIWDEQTGCDDRNSKAAFFHGDKSLYEEKQGSIYKIDTAGFL